MSFTFKFFTVLAVVAGCAYLLSREESTVGVNLHGVNHSAETFSFHLTEPGNPQRISGGSGLIDPFGTSGITCCAVLPRLWTPELRLLIHAKHWVEELPDGTLPEIKEVVEANVPKYADGKPEELWVLRKANGKIEVILSNFQPDHPKWPGLVKGWPVPSIEYRRERWELYRKDEVNGINLYKDLLKELGEDPDIRAEKAWDNARKYDQKSLEKFSGPADPLYRIELRKIYNDGLARSQHRLKEIMESKP